MNDEEVKAYLDDLKELQKSAQWDYRNTHPSCEHCEHAYKLQDWSSDLFCKITDKLINSYAESNLKKFLRCRLCKYYLTKIDLS